jgi:hypothetical protein
LLGNACERGTVVMVVVSGAAHVLRLELCKKAIVIECGVIAPGVVCVCACVRGQHLPTLNLASLALQYSCPSLSSVHDNPSTHIPTLRNTLHPPGLLIPFLLLICATPLGGSNRPLCSSKFSTLSTKVRVCVSFRSLVPSQCIIPSLHTCVS